MSSVSFGGLHCATTISTITIVCRVRRGLRGPAADAQLKMSSPRPCELSSTGVCDLGSNLQQQSSHSHTSQLLYPAVPAGTQRRLPASKMADIEALLANDFQKLSTTDFDNVDTELDGDVRQAPYVGDKSVKPLADKGVKSIWQYAPPPPSNLAFTQSSPSLTVGHARTTGSSESTSSSDVTTRSSRRS